MADEAKISKQARHIMDNFISALKAAGKGKSQKTEIYALFKVDREENIRSPDIKADLDVGFAERMLDNAPKVEKGCIIAEKKKWHGYSKSYQ